MLSSYLLKKNRTLQHVSIDVFEVDTLLPNYYPVVKYYPPLPKDAKLDQNTIHTCCFYNRFLRKMADGKELLARKDLCTGLLLDDERSKVEAIFMCLRGQPNLVASFRPAAIGYKEKTNKTS